MFGFAFELNCQSAWRVTESLSITLRPWKKPPTLLDGKLPTWNSDNILWYRERFFMGISSVQVQLSRAACVVFLFKPRSHLGTPSPGPLRRPHCRLAAKSWHQS